jgi:hypothetical protein
LLVRQATLSQGHSYRQFMIKVDFSLAVSLYAIICLGVILIIWLFSQKQKDKDLTLDPKFIWFCSVCTYTYINTKEEAISACPRCGSFNKKENSAKV